MQPRYAASHVEYGSFLFRQGRTRDAIAPWQRATVLEPDNPSAFNNLGAAYLFTGDFEKAADAFSRSLAIEPTRSGYSNTGTGLYYNGRFSDAAEMFRKATELSPADHRPWGNLADALHFGGHPTEAREAYVRALSLAEKELAINPRHAVNQAQAAYYASRLDDVDRARKASRTLWPRAAVMPRCTCTLGWPHSDWATRPAPFGMFGTLGTWDIRTYS